MLSGEQSQIKSIFDETELGSFEQFLYMGELDGEVEQALVQHFVDNGEMPYDVQKARLATPEEWVGNKLMKLFGDMLESKKSGEPVMEAKDKVKKALKQLREHDQEGKIKVGSFIDYLMLERAVVKEGILTESQVKKAMHAVQGMKPRQAVAHLKARFNMTDDQAGKFAYDAHRNEHRKIEPEKK